MLTESEYITLRVFTPKSAVKNLQQVLADAGAGEIGNYTHCASVYPVTGYFLPKPGATPTLGTVEKLEIVEEAVIETICKKEKAEAVYQAVRAAHPYEEPVIDMVARYTIS